MSLAPACLPRYALEPEPPLARDLSDQASGLEQFQIGLRGGPRESL